MVNDPRFSEENDYPLPEFPKNHIPGDYFCGCKSCQIDRFMIWKVENASEGTVDLPQSDD